MPQARQERSSFPRDTAFEIFTRGDFRETPVSGKLQTFRISMVSASGFLRAFSIPTMMVMDDQDSFFEQIVLA